MAVREVALPQVVQRRTKTLTRPEGVDRECVTNLLDRRDKQCSATHAMLGAQLHLLGPEPEVFL